MLIDKVVFILDLGVLACQNQPVYSPPERTGSSNNLVQAMARLG